MSSNRRAWVMLAVVFAIFAWGLLQLYGLRLESGDIYPVYSSFRADPLGSKALYESIAELPNYSVRRNLRTLEHWHGGGVTLLWLGEDPMMFAFAPDDLLKKYEEVAAQGVRLVIAMRPVKPVPPNALADLKDTALEKRWGVTFTYERRTARKPDENSGPLPKRTALIMNAGGKPANIIEKPFGKGAVVLVANAYPFSNQALAADRDTALLAEVLGPNRVVVFDENHLGYSETASVAELARRYRLWGLAAGLLILMGLFVWRNSSPLLPARARTQPDEAVVAGGRDSASALRQLLRRNISAGDLISTCLAEWERSGRGGRYQPPEKLAIIRELGAAATKRAPLEAYRTLHSVITQKGVF